MAVSNLVAIAIIMSTAATLYAEGKTEIGSAADVADALRPVAEDFAFVVFSLGIIGTGLLSIPVLADSAANAFGESRGWKCGLADKPWETIGFYSVIGAATLLGLSIGFSLAAALRVGPGTSPFTRRSTSIMFDRSERKMSDPTHQTPEEKNTDAVPEGMPFTGENTCRRCKGMGKVDGNRCPDCQGSGKAITPVGGAG